MDADMSVFSQVPQDPQASQVALVSAWRLLNYQIHSSKGSAPCLYAYGLCLRLCLNSIVFELNGELETATEDQTPVFFFAEMVLLA